MTDSKRKKEFPRVLIRLAIEYPDPNDYEAYQSAVYNYMAGDPSEILTESDLVEACEKVKATVLFMDSRPSDLF